MVSVLMSLSLIETVKAAEPAIRNQIDSYVKPYVSTQNFSGAVLVSKDEKTIFAQAYGMSDTKSRRANRLTTKFQIASMSMQFTAAAVLRLIDTGKLALETPVSSVLPDYPHGEITIRQLLTETSGIADINDLPEYDQLLKSHHDAASLVAKTSALPVLRSPGGTYVREEHSAYNLLALIVEKKTSQSFHDALDRLVFVPLAMSDSGIDDDRKLPKASSMATGYGPLAVHSRD